VGAGIVPGGGFWGLLQFVALCDVAGTLSYYVTACSAGSCGWGRSGVYRWGPIRPGEAVGEFCELGDLGRPAGAS
jgi:hypothetical protein